MGYEEDLPRRIPPPFGANGRNLMAAVGKRLDAVALLFRDAVYARLPAIAPDDALDVLGADRRLPRGAGESDDDYRARLSDPWTIWEGDNTPLTGKGGGAGSPLGLLTALAVAGYPTGTTGMTLVQQCGRPAGDSVRGYAQLDGSGDLVLGTLMDAINRTDLTGAVNPRPGWTFGPDDNFYSIFGLLFPAAFSINAGEINSIVKLWRPAKALFVGTWVLQAGKMFGWPTGRVFGSDGNFTNGAGIGFYPGPDGEADLIGYHLP